MYGEIVPLMELKTSEYKECFPLNRQKGFSVRVWEILYTSQAAHSRLTRRS